MSQSQKQWVKHGDKSFKEMDYYGASLYYKKAVVIDSSNLEVVYKYAESLRLYNEYELGEKYYEYIFKKDKGKNYKEALFWLASMQKYNAKYQDARKSFTNFTKIYKDKDSFFYKKAQQEIGSCEYAQQLMQDTLPVNVYNIGPSINTTNAEISPLPFSDSLLYFSSLRSENIKETKEKMDPSYSIQVFKAVLKDTNWVLYDTLANTINNTEFHNGNATFNKSGNTIYFSRCDANLNCRIYVSNIDEGTPKLLEGEVNNGGNTSTQPYLTEIEGKEFLFFVSDRPGGEGRLDIWFAIKEGDGFVNVTNAGKSINSIDDEVSPFYNSKDGHLYFSSGWHFGLGGFDIFKSKGTPGSFDKPENLFYPINTSVNDFYYQYNESSATGFLASNRKGSITAKGETCCNDIWYFKNLKEPVKDTLPDVTALVSKIPVILYFHNDEPAPKTLDTTTTLDYMETYSNYLSLKDTYKEEYAKSYDKNEATVAGKKIEDFFEYAHVGAANLEAFTEQLLAALEKGNRLEITVKGFASPLAETAYNINLTLRRISSMENFMRKYKNGALLPYFDGTAENKGHVRIIKIPFGEYKAQGNVNDKLKNLSQSVYSPAAALERKIEIVSVQKEKQDSLRALIKFSKEIYDFGQVSKGDTLKHSFQFKNTGNKPFTFLQAVDSCECLTVSFPREKINPKAVDEIEVLLDTKDLTGKQAHHFFLITDDGTTKELILTAEVSEKSKDE